MKCQLYNGRLFWRHWQMSHFKVQDKHSDGPDVNAEIECENVSFKQSLLQQIAAILKSNWLRQPI